MFSHAVRAAIVGMDVRLRALPAVGATGIAAGQLHPGNAGSGQVGLGSGLQHIS